MIKEDSDCNDHNQLMRDPVGYDDDHRRFERELPGISGGETRLNKINKQNAAKEDQKSIEVSKEKKNNYLERLKNDVEIAKAAEGAEDQRGGPLPAQGAW